MSLFKNRKLSDIKNELKLELMSVNQTTNFVQNNCLKCHHKTPDLSDSSLLNQKQSMIHEEFI